MAVPANSYCIRINMTLPLSPDVLRAAYDYLNTTLPFSKWNLPDGDDVVFIVVRDPTVYGRHLHQDRRLHTIKVSSRSVGHTTTLMETIAHEMVHVHEEGTGVGRSDVEHSAAFKKWAAEVCRIHGFDPRRF